MDTIVCSYCEEEKGASLFPKYKSHQWKICKVCLTEYNRAYAKENKEHLKKYRREYYLRNRETILEQIRKDSPTYNSNRKHSRVKRKERLAENGTGICPYCNREIGFVYDARIMHIDHIIPLSRGGVDLEENLEPVCKGCNLSKGNKTKEEFLNE